MATNKARSAGKPPPSWIKFGKGAHLCTEHEMQFMTISASQAHSREFHPERVTTVTATDEQMRAGRAAMNGIRTALLG